MAVMGVWVFILCNRHRWHIKQKNKKPWKHTSRFSLKEVFFFIACVAAPSLSNACQAGYFLYIICVEYTKFWVEFGTINICKNCPFIWSGKVYIWLPVWEFKQLCLYASCLNKLMHIDRELKYWSPSTLLVCGHFIQIHSCMIICFPCMYTNNYKHFHKWFCIFYCDNSVLMRVLNI